MVARHAEKELPGKGTGPTGRSVRAPVNPPGPALPVHTRAPGEGKEAGPRPGAVTCPLKTPRLQRAHRPGLGRTLESILALAFTVSTWIGHGCYRNGERSLAGSESLILTSEARTCLLARRSRCASRDTRKTSGTGEGFPLVARRWPTSSNCC